MVQLLLFMYYTKIMVMTVENASGPGIDSWLLSQLKRWGIDTFTDIQERALIAGVAGQSNLIVSAPTSSGKTLVGEIAILKALQNNERAIYLVSHKALADQKYTDFVSKFGENAEEPITSVGLHTGDRSEGDVDARLMVSTYEKALGLVLSGQLKSENAVIVADELQIIGEPSRGPDIEALCSIFRQKGFKQFVALTATVQNPEDLAGWLNCQLVISYQRDVPLHQEVWYQNKAHRTTFGQDQGNDIPLNTSSENVVQVVEQLLQLGRGPVLVFTESKREASQYAEAFGESRPRMGDGIEMAEQLDFFSEPTESSDRLKANAEKRVAFHSADLSPQERQVIESGFTGSKFDACFATSTLAAGVNFPFRSVVFPKLTFQWGDRAGSHLTRSDYRNMSGRAGRLGMHPEGFAILLPCNNVELAHANKLVLPENDRLSSHLFKISLRKCVLILVASRIASNLEEIILFFQNTLYWYQTLNNNPAKLESLRTKTQEAVEWLHQNALIKNVGGVLAITPLGNGAAASGLLPGTAIQLASMLENNRDEFTQSFEEWIPGLIYAICSSQEFRGERPTRYLPFVSYVPESLAFWSSQKIPVEFDRSDTQLAQCAHAVFLYISGVAERKIAYTTKVSGGAIHRLATDVAWVLDGLHKMACIPDLDCPQTVSNRISMLARSVRWGAPAEALDVMRIAEKHGVPGFGRQRAMALVTQGITTLHDVVSATKEKLVQLLRNDKRAEALINAASHTIGFGPSRLEATHNRLAKEIGLESLVAACNEKMGVDYENAIAELLNVESGWVVSVLDDGIRQNVPDLLVSLGDIEILIECKTCSKSPPLIKKEEAWAVLQKAADFDPNMKRVTLGKPLFDETSKKKAAASYDITLVEHGVFMEGLLRVHTGTLEPKEFLVWLGTAGVAEIDRLGGSPTFSAAN